MKLKRATLNGGAGIVVHVVDIGQRRCRAFPKLEALCGKTPGGGVTNMGKRRSRWREVGICATDSPVINCEKCLTKLTEMGINPNSV
jgi:hypothetical protein